MSQYIRRRTVQTVSAVIKSVLSCAGTPQISSHNLLSTYNKFITKKG